MFAASFISEISRAKGRTRAQNIRRHRRFARHRCARRFSFRPRRRHAGHDHREDRRCRAWHGGAIFGFFGEAYIGAAGNITFSGYLDQNSPGIDFNNYEGVWTVAGGSMMHYAREGTPVSGKPSTTWTSMVGAGPSGGSHQTVLKAYSTDGRGLFGGTAGAVAAHRRHRMQAAGMEPGTTYGDNIMGVNINGVPRSNARGETVFTAGTAGPGASDGMWSGIAGNLNLIARTGHQAPAVEPGATIVHLHGRSDQRQRPRRLLRLARRRPRHRRTTASSMLARRRTQRHRPNRRHRAPARAGAQFARRSSAGSGRRSPSTTAGTSPCHGDRRERRDQRQRRRHVRRRRGVAQRRCTQGRAGSRVARRVVQGLDNPFLAGKRARDVYRGVAWRRASTATTMSALHPRRPTATKKLIIREGDAIPGATDGAQLRYFDFLGNNSLGQTHFTAASKGAGVTFDNDFALFAATRPATSLPSPVPATSSTSAAATCAPSSTCTSPPIPAARTASATALNDFGTLVFSAVFEDGTEGIFSVNAPVTRTRFRSNRPHRRYPAPSPPSTAAVADSRVEKHNSIVRSRAAGHIGAKSRASRRWTAAHRR
jgi:hypothetical protein